MPKLQFRLFFPAEKNVRLEDLVLFFRLKKNMFLPALLQLMKKTGGTACFSITSFINSDELGINTERKGSFAS